MALNVGRKAKQTRFRSRARRIHAGAGLRRFASALSALMQGRREGNPLKRFSLFVAVVATFAIATTALAAAPLQQFGTGVVAVTGTSAIITNDAAEYGGVYLKARSLQNKLLAAADFSFTSTGTNAGGAPRFSIPIDTDGNTRTTEGYAFMDVNGCGGDVFVSTTNDACTVWFGSDQYANWDAFAAAHPTYRISRDIPFIIADVEGTYSVAGVNLQ